MESRSVVSTVMQGQAGVHRVASELLLRGLMPCFPAADDRGVDIVLSSGIRIQVKSAHISMRSPYPQGAYWFKFVHGPIVTGNNTIRKRGPRDFSKQCDFVVLWGIEQGRFWIVPAASLDGVSMVAVGPDIGYKNLDNEKIKELYDSGMDQNQLAEHFGVNQMTISRRLRGIHARPKYTTAAKVREYENCWDLFVGVDETIAEINAIDGIEIKEKNS